MASKKAASRKAANKKSVGKKILHMADRCRSRCRSRNGAAPQSHTSPSEELSTMAHEEQFRRASWYWGTVHCLNELEQEGLLGIGTAPGELKWPSDDGAVTHYVPNDSMKQPWTQTRFWDEAEQQESIVGIVQFPLDCNRGKGQGKPSVVPARQIPASETTAGKTTALQCCWDEEEQEESIVGMVQFSQDCNQGKGQGKMTVVPFRKIPPTKQLPAQRQLSSVAVMSEEGFSVMAASACFCRKAILEQARSGSSLRRRTMAFSPFSVAVTSRVFVLNILRAIYNSCAIVVPPGRCGWFRNMPAPTSFLAAAETRGCFSVMAVAGCPCRTAIVAQVSCGT